MVFVCDGVCVDFLLVSSTCAILCCPLCQLSWADHFGSSPNTKQLCQGSFCICIDHVLYKYVAIWYFIFPLLTPSIEPPHIQTHAHILVHLFHYARNECVCEDVFVVWWVFVCCFCLILAPFPLLAETLAEFPAIVCIKWDHGSHGLPEMKLLASWAG